jgi:hypothetical protein
MIVSWKALKNVLVVKELKAHGTLDDENYYIKAIDGNLVYDCILSRSNQNEDLEDFETNWLPTWNPRLDPKDLMLNRTIFSTSAFAVNTDYEAKATGFKDTAVKSVTTSIKYAVGAEDRYINGLELLCKNAVMGDTAQFKVTDEDNLLGYGAGVTLKQFGLNWNIDPDRTGQGLILFNYIARIPAGFYICLDYTSVGTTSDVTIACNLVMHKKT